MHRHKKSSSLKKASPEEAFELFFRSHYATLCQSVYRLLHDKSLAEDLVQEVFLKVWEKRNRLDFSEQFYFYMKKSCYHAALGFLSGKTYKHETENLLTIADKDEADAQVLHNELANDVRLAISRLPEKTQLVFSLSRYEEMTYKEIASELKISIKAVEKHMGIALKRLKDDLKNHLIAVILMFL